MKIELRSAQFPLAGLHQGSRISSHSGDLGTALSHANTLLHLAHVSHSVMSDSL